MNLPQLVADVAAAIKRIDARHPRAASARTGLLYRPGIGPHPETQAVGLIVNELRVMKPENYGTNLTTDVTYPGQTRQMCDVCLGKAPDWEWAIEVKMLRLMGDNGKPNDNMLTHILSPYPVHRSALTDCGKLASSKLRGRKAVLIYGFDYPALPMDPALDAFELLARARVDLGKRAEASYLDLVHPVHVAGRVFGWEVDALANAGMRSHL